MDALLDPNLWIAFAMLTALEIVLGVDNIIFISILVGRLPTEQRDKARRLGLGFAMASRLLLLFSLSWVMGLTEDLFHVAGKGISGRDLVLLLGGLFLLYKASHEIFVEVEAREGRARTLGSLQPGAAEVQIGGRRRRERDPTAADREQGRRRPGREGVRRHGQRSKPIRSRSDTNRPRMPLGWNITTPSRISPRITGQIDLIASMSDSTYDRTSTVTAPNTGPIRVPDPPSRL